MKQSPEAPSACKKCGKPIASGENRGDLVSHMLQDNFCSCDKTLVSNVRRPVPSRVVSASEKSGQDDEDFCPRCGLNITKKSLPGSLTGYLFQDVRCKCTPEADFSPGAMTGKFWNLKKDLKDTTFVHDDNATTRYKSGGNSKPRLTTSSIDLAEGAIIGGAYKILGLIGQGGMGEVYLADHITLGKRCALKLIPPEQVTEIGWRRFQQEARAIAKLEHINLVKVSDLGIHEGCLPFYAMEYIEGETLADLLVKYGPIPYKQAIEIFVQICDGVHDAHKAGVIHRDLKPANIMVSRTPGANTKMSVKVLDFGLAKLAQQDRDKQSLTSLGEIFGSPFYMSPEQCAGEKVDNRSDIYSIGCTLFECLTGQPPFVGTVASAIAFCHQESDPPTLTSKLGQKAVPDSLEVVMAKLLRKNPVERYQTLTELRGDLERVGRGEAVMPFYMSRTRTGAAANTVDSLAPSPFAQEEEEEDAYVISKPKVFLALALGAALCFGGFALWSSTQTKNKIVTAASRTQSDSDLKTGKMTDKVLDTEISHSLGLVTKLPAEMIRDKELKNAAAGKAASDDPTASIITELGREIPGMEDPLAAKPKSAGQTTPFSTIVKKGSDSYRIFDFPSDVKIGGIGPDSVDDDLLPAAGITKFKAGEKLKFAPGPVTAVYPQYLKRFRPEEIVSLVLVRPAETNKMIHAWSQLPDLLAIHDLRLRQPILLDSASLKILASLKNLHTLCCTEACLPADELAKMPFLPTLKTLILREYKDCSPVIEKLENSKSLVRLDAYTTQFSKDNLRAIAKIANLRNLDISTSINQVEDLQPLTTCPKLDELYINGKIPLNQVTLKILQQFKHLQKLHIGHDKDLFDQLTRNRVKAALVGVKLYMGSRDNPMAREKNTGSDQDD